MFERYTEKARRVIFFARYEASNYGSPRIDTEHLLLGLAREGRSLMDRVFGPELSLDEIRKKVEKSITPRKRISTSVEVPLSEDSKSVLIFATEESNRVGSLHVGEGHILLGILTVGRSRAAKILKEKGGELAAIRELLAQPIGLSKSEKKARIVAGGASKLHRFLARLGRENPGELALLLAKNALIVDSTGEQWRGRDEIERAAKRIFEVYAKQGVTANVESVEEGPGQTLVASVLWEHLTTEGHPSELAHRMTIVLAREDESWVVLFLQATPLQVP
jgi:ATP-dependent Clp protease ATP-binding subunit ClpC